MSAAESSNPDDSALLAAWDQALKVWDEQRAAGEAGNLTEFVAGLPTEVQPLVRQEIERSARSTPAPDRPRFERLRELGQGGFGHVELAFDHHLRRQVAIKAARPECDWSAARQLEEARRLASLRHESIVPIYDIVPGNDGGWRIVSAYVEGEPLSARMARGALPAEDAVAIALRLCSALQHAHERGVIHRDVKPSNILLDPHGRPHLLDFGLAILEGASRLAPCIAGTPGYRPPEFERDAGLADPRSDVYSLGVVLHEMLTGRREIAPHRLRPTRPSALLDVCRKATAPEPAGRYASAADFAEAIQRTVPSHPSAAPKITRRVWLRGTASVTGGLGLFAAGAVLFPRVHTPDESEPIRVLIGCSAPDADIGFMPLDPQGRPQLPGTQWTRAGQPIDVAPGDYLVTAVSGHQFCEVFRHVHGPDEKLPFPGNHRNWKDGPGGVELPPIKLVEPRFRPLRSGAGPEGRELLVMPTLATLQDYVSVFNWVPPPLRKGNPPPETPLTSLSFDMAVTFAEACGMRLPEPEELDRIAGRVDFPPGPTSLWTTRLSGTRDSAGRQLLRTWMIPRGTTFAKGDDSHQVNRSAHPPTTGMLFVCQVKPRVQRSP